MPILVLKRKVVGGGDMPSEERDIHREPRNQWGRQPMAELPQQVIANQRTEDVLSKATRQAAEQGHYRQPKQQEGWNKRHQEEMFHHVRAEKSIGEAVQGRGNGDPDCREPKQERSQSPDGKLRPPRLPDEEPTA
jgi:hypothetical protein